MKNKSKKNKKWKIFKERFLHFYDLCLLKDYKIRFFNENWLFYITLRDKKSKGQQPNKQGFLFIKTKDY